MTTVTVHCNCDTQDDPIGTSGVDWIEMNLTYDQLIFSQGSDVVKDGEPIPTSQELTQAAPVITTSDVEIAKFFLADESENELKEIHNAGNQNKRYVFGFEFDGATASEPVLEIWDDDTLTTVTDYSLGNGTALNSFFRGITTTDGLPGPGWTGSRLAGSSSGHFLWLNNENGALSVATNLYCQLRITIPANYTAAAAETPVVCIRFCTN
jgi:hypothetical protein